MPTDDDKVTELLSSTSVNDIPEVVFLLHALDSEMAEDDGVKWFNLLYLIVTEGVRDRSAGVQWENPSWLERLDVVFANLYFTALRDWLHDRARISRCWAPLLESRAEPDVLRVQFALAGINAHINHDLPIALVSTGKELGRVLRRGTPEYRDFDKVNAILEVAEEEAQRFLATGTLAHVDASLGRIDDLLANWSIRKARETAWSNGEILWQLSRLPRLGSDFLVNLDRLVALSSRGLLVPVAKT